MSLILNIQSTNQNSTKQSLNKMRMPKKATIKFIKQKSI